MIVSPVSALGIAPIRSAASAAMSAQHLALPSKHLVSHIVREGVPAHVGVHTCRSRQGDNRVQ
jgi:hypothetical protein